MLKEFKFGNYKSFKNVETLSLEPMNNKVPELDCFNIAEKTGLLKTAAIYGHNSFGKSNMFRALAKMKEIIKRSSETGYIKNIDNFKLDIASQNKPTLFELSFIMNSITYRYGFEVLNEKINKEWLYKKKSREVKVFNRLSANNKSIEISTSYTKLNKFIEFTREDELFLSSMVKNNEQEEVKEIFNWILKNIQIISGDIIDTGITSTFFSMKKITKEEIIKAIRNADINIQDIELIEEEENFESMPEYVKAFLKEQLKNQDLTKGQHMKRDEIFKHNIYNEKNEVEGIIDFNLRENESQGTIKFYSLIGPLFDTLKNGYTLFIDELDSKLHHLIVKYIIELFNSIYPNENNAQLIFNTHDFYLLKEDVFRKDQIYFTDKNKYGVSNLYSLGDFKGIDKKTNLMVHYLLGNFGSLGDVKFGD